MSWPPWAAWALLLALLLLAAALRFNQLQSQSLTRDEINTATSSLTEVIFDGETFVHTLLTQLMMWLTGSQSEFVLRFPSACLGVLGVAATYVLGRRLFETRTALVGAFLLSISRFEIEYAQDVSQYPYLVFASALSLYFLYRAVHGGGSRAWWGFALTTVINLNSHLAAYVVLGVELLWLGLRRLPALLVAVRRDRRSLLTRDNLRGAAFLLVALATLALGPILTAFLSHRRDLQWIILTYLVLGAGNVWLGRPVIARWLAGIYASQRPASTPKSPRLWSSLAIGLLILALLLVAGSSLALRSHIRWVIKSTMERPHFEPRPPWEMINRGFRLFSGSQALSIPFWGVLVAGLWWSWRERREVALLFILWLVVPWSALYVPTGHPFYFRFMMFMLPIYFLAVAAGLEAVTRWIDLALRRWAFSSPSSARYARYIAAGLGLIAVLWTGFTAIPSLQGYYRGGTWDDWQGVARFLEANVEEGDRILLLGQAQNLMYYAPNLRPLAQRVGNAPPEQAAQAAVGYPRAWIVIDLWAAPYQDLFPQPGAPAASLATRVWMADEAFARVDFGGCVVLHKDQREWSAAKAAAAEIELLEQAVALASTGQGHLQAALGADYAAAGRWQEAAAAYEEAVRLEPKEARYHWHMGQVYEELGDREAALAAYQQVLRLEPEHEQAQEALRRLSEG